MSTDINPCHCGYSGALIGMRHEGYMSLTCPECRRNVEAFTVEGLADEWNKPAEGQTNE